MSAAAPVRAGRELTERLLVIACGAVVREINDVCALNGLEGIEVRAVPASYHNRPEKIVPAVARLIAAARGRYARIFVAYGDCGTGGGLDQLLKVEGIERLPGPHCYAFYSGIAAFEAQSESDLTSFYLTDFLVRQFDQLVIEGLGLDRHPELRDLYFANYTRVVYLSQAATPELIAKAEQAARKLGLAFDHRPVGYGAMPAALAGALTG